MSRKDFVRQYLYQLLLKWEALEEERQQLLAAATRITAIQAEKAELLTDAQDALVKFNAVNGTSFTLPQVRAWYDASSKVITQPPPSVVVPNVVGLTQAQAEAALMPLGFAVTIGGEENAEVAEGLVIRQSPVAGVAAPPNSMVYVVLSLGVTP